MAINIADLITELKINAPSGVEIPRTDLNAEATSVMTRWAEDAAQKINERRGVTTMLETIITLVADTTDYSLPAACQTVHSIQRERSESPRIEVLGIPVSADSIMGPIPNGFLPNGQSVTPSIDRIRRTNLQHIVREDQFEMIGGKIRFLFDIVAGEDVKVKYSAIDRSLANLGDDRFTMILNYMIVENIDYFIGRYGASISVDGDHFGADTIPALYRLRAERHGKWISELNSIAPEAQT
jgi:hypothetical protein